MKTSRFNILSASLFFSFLAMIPAFTQESVEEKARGLLEKAAPCFKFVWSWLIHVHQKLWFTDVIQVRFASSLFG